MKKKTLLNSEQYNGQARKYALDQAWFHVIFFWPISFLFKKFFFILEGFLGREIKFQKVINK